MVVAGVVVAALVAGGGVFAYEKKQQNDSNKDLQAQIDTLKAQLAASPTPTATASATASPSATPTPTATAVGTNACVSDNLKLSLLENGGGTAGTYYTNVVLTNSGTKACTIMGFSKVSLLDKDGKVLGTASNSTTVSSTTLTLDPGKAAYAALGFPDPGNFDAGTCSAAAVNLSVSPPGAGTALLTAMTRPYCPGFSVSAVSATKL
jgi:hypothetical protein